MPSAKLYWRKCEFPSPEESYELGGSKRGRKIKDIQLAKPDLTDHPLYAYGRYYTEDPLRIEFTRFCSKRHLLLCP